MKLKNVQLKVKVEVGLNFEMTMFLTMLGCFNPTLGQIWTNPNVGLKMQFKKCTVEGES